MTKIKPFNPLDKTNLGRSVAEALLDQVEIPIDEIKRFYGAGIYAIYYSGTLDYYEPIAMHVSSDKMRIPIYVGKAVPPGARKGTYGLETPPGPALFRRIREHAQSIEDAKNLKASDFQCKFLVVEDIWIPLGESLLIARFSPIWNHLIDGFGNHAPGGGRYKQRKSRWDTLHPGRVWAEKLQPREETNEQIILELKAYWLTL